MNEMGKINYLEIPSKNLEESILFFKEIFGWSFIDYGPDYSSFSESGVLGGFYRSKLSSRTEKGSVLVVIYSDNLEETRNRVQQAKGKILEEIFSFPGGRRFHFEDPSGNELAVWSEK